MPVSTKTKKLRVLIVAPSFDILGGQAVQAARLLERLSQEPGLEVGFLAVNPRLPGVLRKLQSVKYVRTVVTSLAYVVSLFMRVRKYEVIHIFSASYFSFLLAPTPALLIGKLYGKRLLLNYHSGEARDHLQRWRRSAIPTIRLADVLIVPSPYLVRVFAEFELQAEPIFNLIEIDQFRFRERAALRPIFLSNRNFEKHYGVDRVLRAFATIQKRIPEARLIIAGDGPERTSLEELARDLNLQNAEFIGRVGHERIVELYDSTDIFLNGSEIDNQPLSLLEAFACGLPVVTTDAGGIPDMVVPEKTALVVPRGEYEQLAASALRLLVNPVLAQSIIEEALEECRKYRWEAVRDQWLNLYYELVAGSGARQVRPDNKGVISTSAETSDREDSNQRHATLEENQRAAL
jgi:L-malate glycosyltransferase